MKRPPKKSQHVSIEPKSNFEKPGEKHTARGELKRKRKSYPRAERRLRSWRGRFIRAQNAGAKANLEDQAFVEMVYETVEPYRQRGDQYLSILNHIIFTNKEQLGFTDATPQIEQLSDKVQTMVAHLHALKTDRLNYDDMREALEKLHTTPAWRYLWPSSKRKILESSGASKALIGAPVSDAGEMRRALQLVDNSLTAAVKRIDSEKPAPPDALMDIWAAIHGARKALKAVEGSAPPVGITASFDPGHCS